MSSAVIKKVAEWIKPSWAVTAVVLLVAGLLAVVANPATPEAEAATTRPTPQTWASGTTQSTFKDCTFRRGGGQAAQYAPQLCWVNQSGMDTLPTDPAAPKKFTRDLGRYTLSYTVFLVKNSSSFVPKVTVRQKSDAVSTFGNTVNGAEFFTPIAGDASTPVVHTDGQGTLWNNMHKFSFRNIVLTDKVTGKPVTDYRLVVGDAEMQRPAYGGEAMSIDNPNTAPGADGAFMKYDRVTPTGYEETCKEGVDNNRWTSDTENYSIYSDGQLKEIWCREHRLSGTYTGQKTGMFLAGADAPSAMDVGLFSYGTSAFAFAIDMARMTGDVKADTTLEKAQSGQETTFDFKMSVRNGVTVTPVPWQGPGTYTQVTRSAWPYSLTYGKVSDDQMVFSSTGTGAQADQIFKRYDPVWACTVGGDTPVTIKAGSEIPKGYALNNDTTTGTSELVVDNPLDRPASCQVNWMPKFQLAELVLGKTVDGTAKDFTEVQQRVFAIKYECTDVGGFAAAYPDAPLTGTVQVKAGETKTIDVLPANSTCTITEQFSTDNPPARPGKDLDLTWSTGTATATADPELPGTKLTLIPGTNTVGANNNYDYRAGTLNLSKTVQGEAVSEFGTAKTYNFNVECPTTPFARRIELNLSGSGDSLSGSTQIKGIPVERDCYLKPLTGLTAEQATFMKFDGRDVTLNGTALQPQDDGTYRFRLPDYPEGGTPTSADLAITANYSYLTRDVTVLKEIVGPSAAKVRASTTEFPVRYECTVPGSSDAPKTGTLNITEDTGNPEKIMGVRVGAECRIWEEGSPTVPNVTLDSTTVESSDAADNRVSLTNEEAKTTTILTVNDSVMAEQNRVVVRNHYVPQVGIVDLAKLVDNGGLAFDLPADYELRFTCGTRAVELPDGRIVGVPLVGSLRLGDGQTQSLVADVADPEQAALVNDQNGSLGVPYGNTCEFSEPDPNLQTDGIIWETDAEQQSLTVNQPTQQATVTNTFTAAGEGLTIVHNVSGENGLSEDVTYQLECTANGLPVTLAPDESTFTLSESNPRIEIPATTLPEGTDCTLSESSTDPLTRTADGKTFPITRDAEANVPDPITGETTQEPFTGPVTFTIGAATVVNMNFDYDYKLSDISATKDVVFDPATQQFISPERQQVKQDRAFEVQLVCTAPGSTVPITYYGTVGENQPNAEFTDIIVGSTCRATEQATTTAEGIDVKQEVAANGGAAELKTTEFTVGETTNDVQFINTYSRRLASVQLNKIAKTPIDIPASLPGVPDNEIYYTHNFTMTCRDPLTGEGDAGAVLGTFTSTITGPGTTTFEGVPVGADCKIDGDKFGELDLSKTEGGVDLQTKLRPDSVDWLVDRNDGTTFHDTDLADGETTSQYFKILDDVNGTTSNELDLANNYKFVYSPLKMSKEITGPTEALNTLPADATVNFQYRCEGVGYSVSTIGRDDVTLQSTIARSEFGAIQDNGDGTSTVRFDAPEVQVPANAWCTFTEIAPSNVPAEFELTPENDVIAQRVGEENASAVTWDFVNNVKRRTAPVLVTAMHDGYLLNADPAGYTYQLTCDAVGFDQTIAFDLAETSARARTTDLSAPTEGKYVDIPVGVDCVLNAASSPALGARPELETSLGERTPYMQFAQWQEGVAAPTNPTVRLASLDPATLDPKFKAYSYSFTVPTEVADPDDPQDFVIGGAAYHPQDTVDVTFTKTVNGEVSGSPQFTFESTCSQEPFTLTAGEQYTLTGVDINTGCSIREVDDAVDDVEPVLSVIENGELISNVNVENRFETVDQTTGETSPGFHAISFDINSVTTASDTSDSGAAWSLTAENAYPKLDVEKHIDGGGISSVTGAVADTALLRWDAQSMRFTYTVSNPGAIEMTDVSLKEPGLAGRTVVAADGQEYTVGDDGVIPPEVCTVPTLAPGAEHTCSFDVKITEPTTENFVYDAQEAGTVTATATALGGTMTATDSYGAFRPQESIAWALPDTGMKTMVWVLVLGLLLLGIGTLYYLRRSRLDDDAEFNEDDEENLD